MNAALAPESFVFDDEVIVASNELKLSFAVEREYAEHPLKGKPTGFLSAYIAALWRDGDNMANYTPMYESGGPCFRPSEIHIDESGLLSALSRRMAASMIDIRHGFTVQLPPAFIEPVQAVLQTITQQLNDELANIAGATADDQASA